MMKLVFIYGDPQKKLSARLTMLWTKSTCYHVGFTDGVKFWDMNLLRRRRLWDGLYPVDKTVVVDCPVDVTAEYLDRQLDTDESRYGVMDYLLFMVRPIYHLFGKSTRNASGVICSEMVADSMNAFGWGHKYAAVPSPADLEWYVLGRINFIQPK